MSNDNATYPLEQLIKQLTPAQLRKAMRSAYGAEARKAAKIARAKLATKDIHVKGLQSDWEKGIRPLVYSRNGGFMVTVKGIKGKSMHVTRRLWQKPVLMWAEDGTKRRHPSRPSTWKKGGKGKHYAGKMPAYHFIAESEAEMRTLVESDLNSELEKKAERIVRKCGLTIT